MKKIKCVLGLALLITTSVHAQGDIEKACVQEFYSMLFSDDKFSIREFSRIYSNATGDYEAGFLVRTGKLNENDFMKYEMELTKHSGTIESNVLNRMRTYKQQLTQGLDFKSICKQIEKSRVYNEGTEFSVLLELKLTENNIIFFEISSNIPKEIQNIWLSSGESLDDMVHAHKTIEKFKRPGIINDPDGYSNVREKPDKNSQITMKFVKDQIFYYTPTNKSDWWCVYKEEGGNPVGYLHKSRIVKYADFPRKLREKVNKQRGGC